MNVALCFLLLSLVLARARTKVQKNYLHFLLNNCFKGTRLLTQYAQWENEVLHFMSFQFYETRTKIRKHMGTTIGMCQTFILLHTIRALGKRKKPMGISFQTKIFNRKYVDVANFSAYILIFFLKKTHILSKC